MTPKPDCIASDGSMENFYKLFKFGYPKGTIKMFNDWFARLAMVQDSVAPCPWCKGVSELIVVEHKTFHAWSKGDLRWEAEKATDPDRLQYAVYCQNPDCIVKPYQILHFDTPEEARDTWEYRK